MADDLQPDEPVYLKARGDLSPKMTVLSVDETGMVATNQGFYRSEDLERGTPSDITWTRDHRVPSSHVAVVEGRTFVLASADRAGRGFRKWRLYLSAGGELIRIAEFPIARAVGVFDPPTDKAEEVLRDGWSFLKPEVLIGPEVDS